MVSAQIVSPTSQLILNVDISRFRLSPDSAYLEVYYAIYPKNVTLENTHDTLEGCVVLQTKIKDLQKDTVIVNYSSRISILLKDTISMKGSYVGKSIYALPLGSYELSIRGYDYKNPSRKDSVSSRFKLEGYDTAPAISDIDLCTRIVQSDDKNNIFYKNSHEVTPNPSLLFGGNISPVVFSYAELYNMNPDSTYSIIVGVMDARGNFLKQRRRVHKYSARSVVDVNSLDVHTIPSGKYRFVLVVADTLGKEAVHNEKTIFIYNPQIQSVASTSISPRTADFSGLSNDELIDEFRKLQYISSSDDRKAFDKLTTMEARREFLATFWGEIESGRRGMTEISRAIYLERINMANQRYHSMGREGWHTDRGRVYILYGEPDEVERFPNSDNVKPYEIWHYHQIESGIIFNFVDRTGADDYMLVHSTKRGEIQDLNWEQYLR
jgi:GWxTD domain-containing protein